MASKSQQKASLWESSWGMIYPAQGVKDNEYKAYLTNIEEKGQVGELVMDIGCGAHPVSSFFTRKHKRVLIDIAGKEYVKDDTVKIEINIEEFCEEHSSKREEKTRQILEGLRIPHHNLYKMIDMIILSEIINYIDHKKVLREIYKLLKPGGRTIIFNNPILVVVGFSAEKKKLLSNLDIIDTLEETGFTIEELHAFGNRKEIPSVKHIFTNGHMIINAVTS